MSNIHQSRVFKRDYIVSEDSIVECIYTAVALKLIMSKNQVSKIYPESDLQMPNSSSALKYMKPLETEPDESDSDASSLDSEKNRNRASKKANSEKKVDPKSALLIQRNEMKERIVAEVLEKILPTEDDYDEDGRNTEPTKKKTNQNYERMIRWMKIIGCLEMDLHDAVLSGSHLQVRKTLLQLTKGKDSNPEIINAYDQHGCTPLSYAVKIKSPDCLEALLDFDAMVDFIDEKTGRTPLFYSVNNGTHQMSVMLLKRGSNPNAVDFQCVSPLMIAASRNDAKHVRMLCSVLADVDIQDENGWTALHYAAFMDAPDAINALLAEGASRLIKDRNKRKPLHIARFKKHGNCIASLEAKSRIIIN